MASNEDLQKIWEWNAIVPRSIQICIHDIIAKLDELSTNLSCQLNALGLVWMPVVMIAVFKAGGACVALDVTLPEERLRGIVQQVQPKVILSSFANRIVGKSSILDNDLIPMDFGTDNKSILPAVNPSDLLYVVFTSGSTGSEKLSWFNAIFTLCCGGCLSACIQQYKVNFAHLTPSLTHIVSPQALSQLDILVTSGEILTASHAERISLPKKIINAYGPAECTPHATASVIKQTEMICPSIGRGYGARLVPIGEEGELWLEGPLKTSSAFVVDPPWLLSGATARDGRHGRLYKTGDIDAQVKINGQRVELGEVEYHLVAEVIKPSNASNKDTLKESVAALTQGVDELLAQVNIPMTATGKTDRRALHEIGGDLTTLELAALDPKRQTETQAPKTEAEEKMQSCLDDNFLHIGGDSIQAMKLVGIARQQGLALTLAQLLNHSNLVSAPSIELVAPFSLLGLASQCDLDAAQEGLLAMTVKRPGDYISERNFTLRPGIDIERFKKACEDVVANLPILRMRICDLPGMGLVQADSKISDRYIAFGDKLTRFNLGVDRGLGTVLKWKMHHALYDGWSAYQGIKVEGAPFQRFVNYIQNIDKNAAHDHWHKYYQLSQATIFPAIPSPATTPNADEMIEHCFTNIAWAKTNITASTGAYTGSSDVAFVLGVEQMAAPAIATIPLLQLIGLREIRKVSQEAEHGCNFQTLLVVQPPGLATDQSTIFELISEHMGALNGFNTYALQLICTLLKDGLDVSISFDSTTISRAEIERIVSQFEHIIRIICDEKIRMKKLHEINLLSNEDLQDIWNWNARLPETVDDLIHKMIEKMATQQPNSIAIQAWDGALTYAELDCVASRFALHLAKKGVHANVVVPLCFEKSMWTAVSMLSVMKAGAASLLLDINQPEERLRAIIRQINPHIILSSADNEALATRLSDTPVEIEVISRAALDAVSVDSLNISQDKMENPTVSHSPLDLLYVVFTSGSTGTPKGVKISHQNFSSAVKHQQTELGFNSLSRVLDFASYAFDMAWSNFIFTLCTGGCLCIGSQSEMRDDLAGCLGRYDITFIQLTPSLARTIDPIILSRLDVLLLAGEGLSMTDVNHASGAKKLLNAYGPAECSVCGTESNLKTHTRGPPPIGRGIGQCTWVVDSEDETKLVPIGVEGELWLEGPLVGQGYLYNEEHTAVAFVQDPAWLLKGSPAKPGRKGRLYKTGDLVRYTADGALIFTGRKDSQVKIRGQRVELGEVEYHITKLLPNEYGSIQIKAEVVVPLDGNGEIMVLFVCPSGIKDNASHDQLKPIISKIKKEVDQRLTEILPSYMIPSVFVPIAILPLTTTGKIDRKVLKRIGSEMTLKKLLEFQPKQQAERKPPGTKAEELMCNLWATVLGVNPIEISTDDSFLRIGGDSIQAMRLVGIARSRGLLFSVEDVFKQPRLCDLSKAAKPNFNKIKSPVDEVRPFSLLQSGIDLEGTIKLAASLCAVQPERIQDIFPCSPLQEGLIAMTEKQSGQYISRNEFELPKWIDPSTLRAAFEEMATNVSILRTRIVYLPGQGFFQVVVDEPAHWTKEHSDSDMGIGTRLNTIRITKKHDRYEGAVFPVCPSPSYAPRVDNTLEYAITNLAWPSNDITPSTIIRTAWSLLQATYTTVDDVVFGVTVAGRQAALIGIERVAGPTIATVPVRVVLDPSLKIEDQLRRIQIQAAESMMYEHFGLQEIRKLSQEAELGCSFQALLVIQPAELSTPRNTLLKAVTSRPKNELKGQADVFSTYALELIFGLKDSGVSIALNFDSAVIGAERIQRMAEQFEHFLRLLCSKSQRQITIGDLEVVCKQDLQDIWAWNSAVPDAVEMCIHNIIAETTIRQPSAPAICAWDGELSYKDLDELSTLLSKRLIQLGVGRNVPVPLLFEKSMFMPLAMLSVMKSGGCCIAMDINQPEERLRTIISQIRPSIILSSTQNEAMASHLGEMAHIVVVSKSALEALNADRIGVAVQSPELAAGPFDLLYIVFTSGSTGIPKGAQISHQNFASAIKHQSHHLGFTPGSRVLDFASYAFDMAWSNFLFTLCIGGCLCIGSYNEMQNDLAGCLQRYDISFAQLTPSLAHTLILAGEGLQASDIERCAKVRNLVNAYGPAECSNNSGLPIIGKGVGQCTWIVDPNNPSHLVPVGIEGELWLEGPLVGLGYLDDERTVKAFVNDPPWLLNGAQAHSGRKGRLYKTGDLVRYNFDGSLIRGQRHLQEYHDLQVVAEIVTPRGGSNQVLVAFLMVGNENGEGALSNIIPSYMIPSAFIPLDIFPMTTTGKTDRKRLREIGSNLTEQKRVPRTLTERKMQHLWAEVLEINSTQIGIDDSFLRLARDQSLSITLAQVATTVEQAETEDQIMPFSLLNAGLSEDEVRRAAAVLCGLESVQIQDIFPCTPLQEGLLALTEKEFGTDMVRFKKACETVFDAFPILRTRIVDLPGQGLVQTDEVKSPGLGRKLAHFLLTIHHALYDGWTFPILLNAVSSAYEGKTQFSNTPFQAFIRHLQNTDKRAACNFWQAQFKGFHSPPFPSRPSVPQARVAAVIDRKIMDVQWPETDITAPTAIRAAWALVQSSCIGSNDISFVPVPVRILLNPSVQTVDSLSYEQIGLQEIRRVSQESEHACDFATLLLFQTIPDDEAWLKNLSTYPLLIICQLQDRGVNIRLSFDSTIVGTDRVQKIAEQFEHLNSIDLITQQDLQDVWKWNSTVPETLDVSKHPNSLALDYLSNQLAIQLAHAGIEPNMPVPLLFEKSMWMPVSILDSIQPKIFLSSAIQVNIVCKETVELVDPTAESNAELQALKDLRRPFHTLYIIFTSGSTGVPKGARVSHKSFASAMKHQMRVFSFNATSRVIDFASYAFDMLWTNYLFTLHAGGCLCIRPKSEIQNDLADCLQRNRISTIDPAVLSQLDVLAFGGEGLLLSDVARCAGCTPCSTAAVITDYKMAPQIGKGQGQFPIGAEGELWLEGPLEDPVWLLRGAPGTGDLVRYDSDGTLIFCGRKDSQVKIRGQRVELSEVEYHAQQQLPHNIIPRCFDMMSATDERLKTEVSALAGPLQEQLSKKIPSYMVPSAFIPTDRRALREIAKKKLHALCISADDSFFRIGGDSIQAMRLVAAAREQELSDLAQLMKEQSELIATDVAPFSLLSETASLWLLAMTEKRSGDYVSRNNACDHVADSLPILRTRIINLPGEEWNLQHDHIGLGTRLNSFALHYEDTITKFSWTIHHALYDGWSFAIMLNAIQKAYNGERDLTTETDSTAAIHFWKHTVLRHQIAHLSFLKTNITASTVIKTAWALVQVTGRQIPVAGVEQMAAPLIATVPVRVFLDPNIHSIESIRKVSPEAHQGYKVPNAIFRPASAFSTYALELVCAPQDDGLAILLSFDSRIHILHIWKWNAVVPPSNETCPKGVKPVAMLAVMKLGVRQTQAKVILASTTNKDIALELAEPSTKLMETETFQPSDLLYAVFTSGSTGSRVLDFASYAFDMSWFNFIFTLYTGGCLFSYVQLTPSLARPTDAEYFSSLGNVQVVNTEPPIGRGQTGSRLVPIGTEGELWLEGPLTSAAFVEDPIWLLQGSGRVPGRRGQLVFRVELAEVEHHVRKLLPSDEDIHVIAEVVTPYNSIPSYMIPAAFMPLTAIPMTATGKTDRKALQEKKIPLTSEERRLRQLWASVLNIDSTHIDANTSFLRIGDSIQAMRLQPRLLIAPFSLLKDGITAEFAQLQAALLCNVSKGLLAMTQKRIGNYIAHIVFILQPQIDLQRFMRACEDVSAEMPILRTRSIVDEPIPWQGENIIMGLGTRLSRFRLSRDDKHGVLFSWTIHHALYDTFLVSMVLDSIDKAYLDAQRAQYVPFQKFICHVHDINASAAINYWKGYFDGSQADVFPQLPLPGYSPSTDKVFNAIITNITWPNTDVTPATVIRTAWALLQALYTSSNDVVFGCTVTGRQAAIRGAEHIAVKFPEESDITMEELQMQIQQQSIDSIPFEQMGLQNIRKINEDAERGCQFQTLLVVQPANLDGQSKISVSSTYALELIYDSNFEHILRLFLINQSDLETVWNWNASVPETVKPYAPAICAWDGELTYIELESLAYMPLCFEKSMLTAVAAYAVWKTGAACFLSIIQQIQPKAILSSTANKALAYRLQEAVVGMQLLDAAKAKPTDLLYVGATVSHQNFASFSSTSRVLDFASYSFDMSWSCILFALCNGGCLCCFHPTAISGLKVLLLAGEAMSSADISRFEGIPKLLNAYGPSDSAVSIGKVEGELWLEGLPELGISDIVRYQPDGTLTFRLELDQDVRVVAEIINPPRAADIASKTRQRLAKLVPSYMIPSALKTIGGALTTEELAALDPKRGQQQRLPTTAAEKQMQNLWASILDIDASEIYLDDSFHTVGARDQGLSLTMADILASDEEDDQSVADDTASLPFSLLGDGSPFSINPDIMSFTDVYPMAMRKNPLSCAAMYFDFPSDMTDVELFDILRAIFILHEGAFFHVISDAIEVPLHSRILAQPLQLGRPFTMFHVQRSAKGPVRLTIRIAHAQYDGLSLGPLLTTLSALLSHQLPPHIQHLEEKTIPAPRRIDRTTSATVFIAACAHALAKFTHSTDLIFGLILKDVMGPCLNISQRHQSAAYEAAGLRRYNCILNIVAKPGLVQTNDIFIIVKPTKDHWSLEISGEFLDGRYFDGQEGACGCGAANGANFPWQLGISSGVYTAAGSQALYDTAGASWCGAGCGKCYNLTSTGEAPCSSCGTGGVAGQSIIVMVTNLCPNNGNAQWCPTVGGTNQYGYSYHFDIMAQNEIFGDNVVVDFEPVACPGQATSDWETCLCVGMQETDPTPVGLGDSGSAPPPGSSSTRPSSTTTSTAPSGSGTQSLYGQCGGIGWTGPTACQPPATCKKQNDYYSQCLS
ncbi:non-ribosomal peptide synthetase [Trichoderma asperelloides]|nr:non-ribosomal peptide synthetase [Trichoderma asperelloides]